jgi:hypothetical protein
MVGIQIHGSSDQELGPKAHLVRAEIQVSVNQHLLSLVNLMDMITASYNCIIH